MTSPKVWEGVNGDLSQLDAKQRPTSWHLETIPELVA
jgi:hypothetical protein